MFPTPADTDLVKNGADAIRDLGDAVDTAMNTALGTKKAMGVLLNTTTFSGVSSFSLPANTFSSNYDNYQIVFSCLTSAGASINLRMRAAGTDNSTANSYVTQYLVANNTGVSASRTTSNLFDGLVYADTTLVNGFVLDMFDPFLATPTGFCLNALRSTSGGWNNIAVGTHNQSVSYDSATFIASAGNFTGKVSVYGRNK